MKKIILGTTSAILTSQAWAHPGHDHSHFTSDLIHMIAIGAGLGITAIISYSIMRKLGIFNKKEK